MAVHVKSVFFTLLCACYFPKLCTGKRSWYRIGAFFNENQLDFPINWSVINDTITEQDIAIYYPNITYIKEGESVNVIASVCDLLLSNETPLLAIFSIVDDSVASTLTSICAHYNVPHITINPNTNILGETTLNLYPEHSLLSQAFGKIVESFHWDGFIILYENDDALLRLQDVIKLQPFSSEMTAKENVMIIKLEEHWDNRQLLKSLKNVTIRRIILDCHVDRVMDILQQADEIKMLSDFSTSVFITSLDAHILDLSSLDGVLANITTVRLFNLNDKNFKKVVQNYFPEHSADKIRVNTALFYDALLLLGSTINELDYDDFAAVARSKTDCDSWEKPLEKSPLFEKLKQTILTDSLSGEINFKNGVRGQFIMEAIEIMKPDRPIAIWYSETPEKAHLTRNATEREAELQKRLSSHNFIVTSRIMAPYLSQNKDAAASGNARYYGYSMDLITEIAKLMNITFEFRITEGNLYANLAKDLIERKADLGICDFTITPQRREVIDFSIPFMNLGISILHKKSTQPAEINMYGFIDPFSWSVWLYMWSLNLVISLIMFVVARMAPDEWEPVKPWDSNPEELENIWDFKNFLWLTLGSITTQGCDILPKAFSTRVISAAWWFFSLIMSSSYTANLAAFLTAQKKEIIIDNVEELAAQSTVKYGLVAGASTELFFANSNNSLYQKMWFNMVNENPSVFEPDNDKDADYRPQINEAVLKLQESGKLAELKDKWWKKMRDGDPCPPEEPETTALTLANVGGIFIVLGVGIAIAYLVAILEFLWNVRKVSVEEKVPFLEALKVELKFAVNIFKKKKEADPISSRKSLSLNKSQEKLAQRKSMSHLSVPTILTNNELVGDEKSLRKRSGSSRVNQ